MKNGTGVIKVYLVPSKKYAYRLRFACARAPEWVLEALKEINPEATIGFEDGSTTEDVQLHQVIEDIENQQYSIAEDEKNELKDLDDEVHFIGDNERQTVVMQSIKSVEESWDDTKVKQEEVEEQNVTETQSPNVPSQREAQGIYVTHLGRVSRPPNRLIETAYAT